MLRVRRTNGREKRSCQEEKTDATKKPTSYSKATLKEKLRHTKVFHVIFDFFLFTLLNAATQ